MDVTKRIPQGRQRKVHTTSSVPPPWNVPGCYDTFWGTHTHTHTHTRGGNLSALRSYIYNSPVYKHLLLSELLILSPCSISTSFL